jgi:hypothetical protein
MGMPFPLALSRQAGRVADLVPWAWGLNGCGSVISSMVATLLAIHFGFGAVIMVAPTLYLLVAVSFPGAGKGERLAQGWSTAGVKVFPLRGFAVPE